MSTGGLRTFNWRSLCISVASLVILLISSLSYTVNSLDSCELAEPTITAYSSARTITMCRENGSAVHVESGRLYTDYLPPGGSTKYAVEVSEECLVSFFSHLGSNGAVLDVEAEGPANRTRVAVLWTPEPYIYYVSSRSEVRFLVTNREAHSVNYTFYLDISEPLTGNNIKIIPFEGGKAIFHVDLRKDDRMLLRANFTDHANPRIWVFVLYYDLLPEMTYRLRLYEKSLYGALYFAADLGRRYYVIIDSAEDEGGIFIPSSVFSPPWNQEWFWLAVLSFFLMTAISLTDIERMRKLGKTQLSALVSCYFWFITIGLSVSVAGSFSYGTLIYMPLFYLLVFSLTGGHALEIYAAYLDRKETTGNCPNCGNKVNIKEVNYCCGGIIKKVSDAWFLLPLSLGFLSFTTGYIVIEKVSPAFLSLSLWLGSSGSIIGGVIGWWINRNVCAIKAWKQDPKRFYIPSHLPFIPVSLLATGLLFSFLSPLLVGTFLETFLRQHEESYLPAHALWVRIRIAPLTMPFYAVLGSTIAAIVLGSLVAHRVTKILTRNSSAF